jgi:hypothetical protein
MVKSVIRVFLTTTLILVSVNEVFADFTVPANSNIYGAGLSTTTSAGGGNLPVSIPVSGPGYLTFSVSGIVSYNGGGNYYGADGLPGNPGTNLNATGVISGTLLETAAFPLVGVFLNTNHPATMAPPIIDFTNTSFLTLSPGLNQVFFVGDGLTGTGTGSTQQFFIPAGATTLYLGFADGNNFTGQPTTYTDDIGSLDVSFSQVSTQVTTPAPASFTLLAVGLTCLVSVFWRRFRCA